jgi:hypothetical protein
MARHSRFQRRAPFRESKPTILIASEGQETEPLYFDELKTRHRGVVTVIISAGRSGQTNPRRVLKRLKEEISKRASWTHRDQAWLVVDTDQWSEAERREIQAAVAEDTRIHLAASNPCFELWLLLHFRDAWEAITAADLGRLLKSSTCFGAYEKEAYDASSLMGRIEDAIGRAKVAGHTAHNQWPTPGTTHVYKVVEKIIQDRFQS